jgi:hypothetical protein
MLIVADPDNTLGTDGATKATTYTFRATFGPESGKDTAMYQCEDQTIDFSYFY